MTTSGSDNFAITRNEIISQALTLLGVYRPGATISSADYTFCSTTLNTLMKSWEAQGIHLWTEEEGALFLSENQSKYILSSATTDKIGKDPIQTQLDADCTTTAVTVISTVGMAALDNIGIALDDNTIHWTIISSITNSTTLVLNSAPASIASSGNSVYTYTSNVGRPLFIYSARLQMNSGVERSVEVMGRSDFMEIPNKQSQGVINSIHYSPKASTGTLYVWMVPSDVNECIRFTYARSIQDLDSSSDNPDFPQEWYDALITNLASKVASTYGIDIQRKFPALYQDSLTTLAQLQMFDLNEGSSRIVPNDRYDD